MKFEIDFRVIQSYAMKNQRKNQTKNPKQKNGLVVKYQIMYIYTSNNCKA